MKKIFQLKKAIYGEAGDYLMVDDLTEDVVVLSEKKEKAAAAQPPWAITAPPAVTPSVVVRSVQGIKPAEDGWRDPWLHDSLDERKVRLRRLMVPGREYTTRRLADKLYPTPQPSFIKGENIDWNRTYSALNELVRDGDVVRENRGRSVRFMLVNEEIPQ